MVAFEPREPKADATGGVHIRPRPFRIDWKEVKK